MVRLIYERERTKYWKLQYIVCSVYRYYANTFIVMTISSTVQYLNVLKPINRFC